MAEDGGKNPFTGPEPVNSGSKENIISNGDSFMVKSLGKYLFSTDNQPASFRGNLADFHLSVLPMLLPILSKENLIDRYGTLLN